MPCHPDRVRRHYASTAEDRELDRRFYELMTHVSEEVCAGEDHQPYDETDDARVQAAPLWGLFFPIRYGTESRVTASGDPLPSESRVTANAIEGDTFTDFWGV